MYQQQLLYQSQLLVDIILVINLHFYRVEEDLTEWIGSVDQNKYIKTSDGITVGSNAITTPQVCRQMKRMLYTPL